MEQTLSNTILQETLLNQKDINTLKQQLGSNLKTTSTKELEKQMSEALLKQPVPEGHYRSVTPPSNELTMHRFPDHHLRTSSWHPSLERPSSTTPLLDHSGASIVVTLMARCAWCVGAVGACASRARTPNSLRRYVELAQVILGDRVHVL